MLRKQPKAIRNKRRKRLTKKEYIKVKPPSNIINSAVFAERKVYRDLYRLI
jgi:hypothetical protein